jgi:hypothetical protein
MVRTEKDLRLEYKKETGLDGVDIESLWQDLANNADQIKEVRDKQVEALKALKTKSKSKSKEDIDLLIEELKDLWGFDTDCVNFEYFNWLEEKLVERWVF